MLEDLKFVQGAVAKKDLMPALTHVKIEEGTVRSFNGTIALSSPIAFDIDCVPRAMPFINAIGNCEDTVSLSMTKAGRLGVKSGPFKAFIDCVDDNTPHVLPEGEIVKIDGEALLAAVKLLKPFISDDSSKPWSNGVLFKGQSAFATNNIIVIEYWLGATFPYMCNIPRAAVNELVRINKPPVSMQVDETSITFHFAGDRWLRTALLNSKWPDVERILPTERNDSPIVPELFTALEAIKKFTMDKLDRVYLQGDSVQTSLVEGDGAAYTVDGLNANGVYAIPMLLKLAGVAETADFSTYPKPTPFFGPRLRGVIAGYKS